MAALQLLIERVLGLVEVVTLHVERVFTCGGLLPLVLRVDLLFALVERLLFLFELLPARLDTEGVFNRPLAAEPQNSSKKCPFPKQVCGILSFHVVLLNQLVSI